MSGPSLPRTFLILALKVCVLGNPLVPGILGLWVTPLVGDIWQRLETFLVFQLGYVCVLLPFY